MWRVFYTRARAEKKVEAALAAQGVEVFLPVRAVRRKWSDRVKEVREPLFPNYVFARVDEAGRLRVLQTDGVVRSVAFGGALAELSEAEVAQLRLTQADPTRLAVFGLHGLQVGQRVVVTEGPFKGLEGPVLEERSNTFVAVQVPALQQGVRVLVDVTWLRPVGEHGSA